jgi:undecaprenyl-diphosphatase
MNDYLLAVILGVVEGLTEFLPVSSTAHIRIAQALLAGQESLHSGYWKMFAVLIQFPAILAVVVYFRSKIIALVKSFFEGGITVRKLYTHPLALVAIATAVTVVPVALAKKLIKGNLESLLVMGIALLVGGIVMWVVDALARKPKTESLEQITPLQAAWIGAVQVLSAIFPGTSRSMATIAGGQLAGLSRPTALEFSFFLSIPIMALAFAKDLWDSLKAPPGDPAYIEVPLDASRWIQIGIGSATSFVVALAVIAWFMGWVKKRGFVPFAIYRIIVGIALIVWATR